MMRSKVMPSGESSTTRPWSDLPFEMLTKIVVRLALIDLLSFRGTCKDWRAASSTTTAQNESHLQHKPWLLLYEKGTTDTKTILCNTVDWKKYKIDIPELRGAHCLASLQGWLLLHYECGSLIFFSPFSQAKIELPKFPILKILDHVAALSAPPTSKKCIICVINRQNELGMDLHVLHHGDEKWMKIEYLCALPRFNIPTAATYDDGSFYFLDDKNKLLTYSEGNNQWHNYNIVETASNEVEMLPFWYKTKYFEESCMWKLVELENDVSISTCGTVVPMYGIELVIHKETVNGSGESEKICHHNGIWIQPRFCQISSNESWSL